MIILFEMWLVEIQLKLGNRLFWLGVCEGLKELLMFWISNGQWREPLRYGLLYHWVIVQQTLVIIRPVWSISETQHFGKCKRSQGSTIRVNVAFWPAFVLKLTHAMSYKHEIWVCCLSEGTVREYLGSIATFGYLVFQRSCRIGLGVIDRKLVTTPQGKFSMIRNVFIKTSVAGRPQNVAILSPASQKVRAQLGPDTFLLAYLGPLNNIIKF